MQEFRSPALKHHWAFQYTDAGTQIGESPVQVAGEFHPRTPLSPLPLGNPFIKTPSPNPKKRRLDFRGTEKENGAETMPLQSSPKQAKSSPQKLLALLQPAQPVYTVEQLYQREENQRKKNALTSQMYSVHAALDDYEAFSLHAAYEDNQRYREVALKTKMLLKSAITAALRDPDDHFLKYLTEQGLLHRKEEAFELIEKFSGNLSRPDYMKATEFCWQRKRNIKLFQLFLRFDVERRDIFSEETWTPHPAIQEALDFLFGNTAPEFPPTLLRENYLCTGFFSPEDMNHFAQQFDEIRSTLRNGIIKFGENATEISSEEITDFIGNTAKKLVALRDAIKPRNAEAKTLIATIDDYTNFVYELRGEATVSEPQETLQILNTAFLSKDFSGLTAFYLPEPAPTL